MQQRNGGYFQNPLRNSALGVEKNHMKKTILYRLFGLGSVPKKLFAVLEQEGIIVFDEGMGGWFIAKHVDGPGKRYRYRSEGFSGCLAVTNKRVVCYAYRKFQINISVKDPKIPNMYVDVSKERRLSVSFESSVFRDGWKGVIEFRFDTEKASLFRDALVSIGAQQGAPPDSNSTANHCCR
jgi:hypothetical protein